MNKMMAKIRGGVNVPHFKETAESESVKMPPPAVVILPMQQHIGKPCHPVVNVGDKVSVGQMIGDSEAFISAPIHATVSGTVKAILPYSLAGGVEVDAIHIENDGKDTSHTIKRPQIKNREGFLQAVRQSGIVGMGGAGFPAHAKLTLKDGVKVDTLVINGAECEPYITADYREIIENHTNVLAGVELVMKYIGIDNCVIGIENNKPKAIALLADEIVRQSMQKRISVMELPAKYPYGSEKMIVRAVTGRTIPLGGLPGDVGIAVLNISTVSALNYYLDTGMPLVYKRITVDGKAVANPQNVIVSIGTPIQDIINFCGGFTQEPEKIIKGGPMMGVVQQDRQTPIFKQDNAILCLTANETYRPKDRACIRCSRCVQACPMSLTPIKVERYVNRNNDKMLKKLCISGCMECGSCAYVCPAKRPLVQHMRQGKQIERKAELINA